MDIDISNPTPQQKQELERAVGRVLKKCAEEGGRLVCRPLPHGIEVLRVKG